MPNRRKSPSHRKRTPPRLRSLAKWYRVGQPITLHLLPGQPISIMTVQYLDRDRFGVLVCDPQTQQMMHIANHCISRITFPRSQRDGSVLHPVNSPSSQSMMESQMNDAAWPSIRDPQDAWPLLADLRDADREHLRVFVLDTQKQVLHSEDLYIGTVEATMARVAEILRPAILHHAVALLIAHNHPSGGSQASQADIQTTRMLEQAALLHDIQLLDHLIVAGPHLTSLRETLPQIFTTRL
jgi:DNA repair protein RadC